MLLYSEVRTYSYSGGTIALLATTTTANLLTSIATPTSCLSIDFLNDIDIYKFSPSFLYVLVYCTKSASRRSVGIILNEQTLAYHNVHQPGNAYVFFQVTIARATTSPNEVLTFSAIDFRYEYDITGVTSFTSPTFYSTITTYIATNDANMGLLKTVLLPANVKGGGRWLASSSFAQQAFTYYNVAVFLRYKPLPSYSLMRSTYTAELQGPTYTALDNINGDLSSDRVMLGVNFMYIWFAGGSTSELHADDLGGGIIYQTADNSVIVTDCESTLFNVSKNDCFMSPSTPDFSVSDDCLVTNCAECNFFNDSQCKICSSGYLLSTDLSTCIYICNPSYSLLGSCISKCPIEYFHFDGPLNNCASAVECSATFNGFILGDKCVTSCPPGGTVNASNYCVAPAGSAAEATSTAAYVTKCPGGELFWEHYQQCTTVALLPTATYTTTATTIYCDGATHFYDIDSHRCLTTCGLYQGTSPTMGKFCASGATCTTTLAWFTDITVTPNICVASCTALQWTNLVDKSCRTSCPGGTLLVISAKTCVGSCPGSTYLLSANSSCLTSAECTTAFSNTGKMTPSTTICSAVCAGGLYLHSSSSSCLTSAECLAVSSGNGRLTPSTMTCTTICAGGLYFDSTTSSCLTSSECLAAFSGSGKTSPSLMTCSAACGASLYLLPASSSCLTLTACLSSFSNLGLITPTTMTCAATCTIGTYLLTTSSSCLTSSECLAVLPASGGSLISEADSKCVSTCNPGDYLLLSTSQCLAAAICKATFSNTGLLSEVDKRCVATCGVNQYKNPTTSQCLTSAECQASHFGVGLMSENDRQCVAACSGSQYLEVSSKQCLLPAECWSISKLISPTSKLCEAACTASEYRDPASQYCYTAAECTALGLSPVVIPGNNLCQVPVGSPTPAPSTVPSCATSEYFEAVSATCITNLQCNSLAKNIENSTRVCIDPCPATFPVAFSGECWAHCPRILEESDGSCVGKCPESATEDGRYCRRELLASFLTSAETAKDILIVKILVKFTNHEKVIISNLKGDLQGTIGSVCLIREGKDKAPLCDLIVQKAVYEDKELVLKVQYSSSPQPAYRSVQVVFKGAVYITADSFRSYFGEQTVSGLINRHPLGNNDSGHNAQSSFIKPAASSGGALAAASVAAAPFIMAGSIDLRLASVFCLVAQTYAKLTLLTYMNFTVEATGLTDIYYQTFKEFWDQYNDRLIGWAFGSETLQELGQNVCDSGFEKFCFLKVADNFWLSKLLDFLILGANYLLMFLLYLVLSALKMEKWKTAVKKNIKEILIFTFLIDNNLTFIFNLLLNMSIHIYRDPLLSAIKVAGFLLLAPYVVFYCLFPFRNNVKVRRFFEVVHATFGRVTQVFSPLAKKDRAEEFTTVFLVHDLSFCVCLMISKFAGMVQPLLWAAFEIGFLVFILKRRFLANTALLIRQIVAEVMFLLLVTAMAATHFEGTNSYALTAVILGASMLLLWLDITFCVCYTIFQVIKFLKERRKKVTAISPLGEEDLKGTAQNLEPGKAIHLQGKKNRDARIIQVDQINPHRFMSKKELLRLFELPASTEKKEEKIFPAQKEAPLLTSPSPNARLRDRFKLLKASSKSPSKSNGGFGILLTGNKETK